MEAHGSQCRLSVAALGALLVTTAVVATCSTNLSAVREAYLALGTRQPSIEPKLALKPGSRVLVTGGAGFIGYHLSRRLHAGGVHVVALDNLDPYYSTALKRARQARLEQLGVEVVHGDMCDTSLLSKLLSERRVTHVASMAAQAGVRFSLSHPQVCKEHHMHPQKALSRSLPRAPDPSPPTPSHPPHRRLTSAPTSSASSRYSRRFARVPPFL